MSSKKTRIATAATVLGLGGLAGVALSAGGQKASTLADEPLVRTQVVHRTVHVTKHAKPKHPPAAGGPGSYAGAGGAGSAGASATTGASSTGSAGGGATSPVVTGGSSTGGSGGGEVESESENEGGDGGED